ncbi:TPA: Ig-like domain-containing protein [Streptococcus pneumoniae]|nr:Ig-like domain-containing protein [Streptococcus pneumoniae]
MGKGHWNRKRVYSIRKFAVGACSVMIGTCAVLLGGNIAGESVVYADETLITHTAEKPKEEKMIVEEKADKALETKNVVERTEQSEPSSTEAIASEKKEDEAVTPKEEKVSAKLEEKAPRIESQASSQEKPLKEDAKAVTNEEMNQMIEDRKVDFNQNWYFKLNANSKEAIKPDADVSTWKKLDLPYDWSIFNDFDHESPAQNEGGQLNGGEAWYRKTFKLDEKDLKKNVSLTFDGVYMDSQVYVNGQLVGHYPNGYNQFSYDITKYLHKDGRENVIAVHAVNKQPSSRWYSGSGIYRDVTLQVTDKVHVEKNGTTILTPKLEEQQHGKVETHVTSKIVNTDDKDHELVAEYQIVERGGHAVTGLVRTASRTLKAHESTSLDAILEVERPKLWTVLNDKPALYELITRVYRDGQLVDAKKDLFGYRYYHWTPNEGFSLNGERIKFHGVSLHHDHGALGAEENYKAEYRRLKQMKEMGVNSIRTTHNPASEQTLQIAAELGLLVQEEAFDTWYGGKKPYDYGRFFEKDATHPEARKGEKWSDFDLRTMVERGKNNPAIFMWSIGNEIGEANGDAHSLATVKRLVKVIKDVDKTRYVTMGADKFRFGNGSGGHEKIADELDAVGFNYSEDNYKALRAKHPKWLIYGSETSSATRTRGSYYRPERELKHSNGPERNYEQSDYGNDRVGWGKTATASWTFDRDNAGYAGQFIWTGTDYIGEPTPWHNQNQTPVKSSYFGIVDTAGIPKHDFYLYQSQWVSVKKKPMVHLLPHWNWENKELASKVADSEGKIPVRAYSNASSVELFLNGKSLGLKTFNKKQTSDGQTYQEGANANELYLEWKVAYQPGTLEAIARDESGKEIARDKITTAGKPAAVRLIKEDHAIAADGKDLTYIYYEIVDSQGNVVPTANNLVRFQLHGQGQLVGVDNGEQASRERYKAQADGSWIRKAFNGKGVAIVKSTEQAGKFTLTAHSDLLKSNQVTVFTGKKEGQEKTVLGTEVAIRKGMLELHKPGAVTLKAEYEGAKGQVELTIQANTEKKIAQSIRPVNVVTDLHQKPTLPTTVTVEYDKGFPKAHKVTWQAIPKEKLDSYQTFEVLGKVEGIDLEARAKVSVEGIVSVEEVSVTTPIAEAPQLPESVRTYDSNGHVSSAKVAWDAIRPEQYAKEGVFTVNGRLEGTQLTTKLHVRVSAQTEQGANISDQWTGSELPLAFASDSNPSDPVSNVNDKLISYNNQPANRWTNWNRTNPEASVGVLFGDSGILSKRSVDNLSVGFHEDHGVGAPKSYVIEYYVGKIVPTAPKNPSFVGNEDHVFNDSANWKPVTNLKAPAQLKAGEMNHFSFDKVETYAVRIRMVRADNKLGTSITEVQIFAKQVAAAKQGQTRIQVDGKDLANFNPDLTDYYLESVDGKVPAVTASVSNNGLATVVPSVREGEPVRVIAKAENGDILGEYRLHFTKDKNLLSHKPVAAVKQARLLQVGQALELPTKVPVYFTGKDGYETKDLTVEWEEVPAENLTKAGQFTVRGRVLGSNLVAEVTVRVTDKLGETLSDNPNYDENSNQAFASATNDIDKNSHDRVDYLNDGDHSENRRWTNWSPTPSSNPEVSAGVIFRENGKIVERTVAQGKVQFFADSGTDAPSKLVLERYVGPEFEVPTYYSNYQAYDADHPFNNPENWEAVPYRADKDIEAGDEINVTFKAVKAKAMRWRMERKADKSGVAMIEMTFLAPSELPQESTQSKILVDGKELADFAENRQDYQITYKGQRPKVSVEENNQVASTVVDSGEDSLPVLVRLVSESGKQVKEYRIHLTKEKPVSEKIVAAVQEDLPKLEFVEKDLAYKTVEKKDSTLYLGETRVEQEGKTGKERIFTAINPDGSKEEKLREVVEAPTDRIVLVGTKPVAQEAKKPQVSEKADTKPIDSSEASQTNKAQLPNTGSAASQAAVAAGLALLGLSAGLVVTKGKKED